MSHLVQQAVELLDFPLGEADVDEHLVVQHFGRPLDRTAAGPGDDRQRRPSVGGVSVALDEPLGLQSIDRAR